MADCNREVAVIAIGLTCLVAFVTGGLGALLVATGAAIGTKQLMKASLRRSRDDVYDDAERRIRVRLRALGRDKENAEEAAFYKEQLKELKTKQADDVAQDETISNVAGVAGFADPLVGVVGALVVGHSTEKAYQRKKEKLLADATVEEPAEAADIPPMQAIRL